MLSKSTLLSGALLLLASTLAPAAVSQRFAGGFELSYEAPVQLIPRKVFRGFGRISQWWDAAHSFSGKAKALHMWLRPGGCFCETSGSLFVRHLEVVRLEPDKRVVLQGGLGPLQTMAVHAVLVVEVKGDEASGRKLHWRYRVSGDDAKATEALADPVDQVLGRQFGRFVDYLNEQ